MLGSASVGVGCNGWGWDVMGGWGVSRGRCNGDKREKTLRYAAVIVFSESIFDRILDSGEKRGGVYDMLDCLPAI